jgi:microsomal dipeptidase-like Zn-dependent dipeptidase
MRGFDEEGADTLAGMSAQDRFEYARFVDMLEYRFPPAAVTDFVDHIDYAVQLIGIDHVGISSDFDGGGGIRGWDDASETFNVTLELVRRGYPEEDIAKLWGGNLLRVWREAERVAAEMQAGR